MEKFEAAYARWVVNNRLLIMVVCIAVIAGLGAGGAKLRFDTSYRAFFSADNPELIAFENVENTYNKDDNVIAIFAPKDGNVFTRETLAAIEEFTTAAWQIPYSNRVDSITNFQYTYSEEDDLIVRDMVKDAPLLSDEALADARRAVMAEPALVDRLISSRGHVTGVNVTLQIPVGERAESTPVVVEFVRDLVADFTAKHPGIEVHLSGMIMMDQAFFESAMDDTMKLIPISFALMLGLIALLVGGFFGTIVTLLIIVFSIIGAMGAGGHVGFPLTGVSSSAPIIILTVAVANCVHILVTFIHDMHEGKSKIEAMQESLRVNLQPVFLASATTAIGFMTMNFSEVPPFNHLGTIVSIGVLLSFIMTVSFLPAAMTLLPVRVKKTGQDDYARMAQLGEFVIARRTTLLWVMAAVVVTAVANLPRNELNDVFLHYFDKSIQFRNSSDFMIENLTGVDFINYSVDAGESGGISAPAFQRDVEAFAEWLEAQPEVVHVNSYSDTIKRLSRNMHGDDPDWYRLPAERELAAQYLL
ncbi:MAG: efflux RND transporter permease subunit, partial [Gammaproteobacteria bacterium]